MSESISNAADNLDINYNSFVGMSLNLGTRYGVVDITTIEDRGDFLDIHYLSAGQDSFLVIKKDEIRQAEDGSFKIKSNIANTSELTISPIHKS